jgi:hypothetical protein
MMACDSIRASLGSIAVHAEEMLSMKRHQFDVAAMRTLLDDAEVRAWIKAMGAYVPVKR